MKKSLLLTTALCATLAASATDYTPKNWDFANMPVGSAKSIFLEKGASTVWNIKSGFQNYTDGESGGICLANWKSGGTDQFANFTEEDKTLFSQFYEAARIVDGGSENLLCIVGNSATGTYPGGVQAPAMPYATLFWLSGEDMPLDNYYRLTIEYRAITSLNAMDGMQMTIGGADWYGIDTDTEFSGNGDGGYREYKAPMISSYSNTWLKATIDFFIDQKGAGTNTLPIGIKMNLADSRLDQSVLLFRTVKLESIEQGDATNVPGTVTPSGFVDDPSGSGAVEAINFDNDVIVTAANGNITVIDANAPVEVYNMAGAKVASVAAPATVETISLDMNGVFVVKVGDKVQKVIL